MELFATGDARWAAAGLGLALPLAWAIDARCGEPRNALHPVAWLGQGLRPLGLWLRARPPALALWGGALTWLAGAAGLAALAWVLQSWLLRSSPWWALPLLALLLKPMFAWRMLRDEVAGVEAALGEGIDAARARLQRLVSRDVAVLDAEAVRESALETLAENLNDSVVAPLFWYACCGLPGAVLYRYANTLDAMWGYRGAWEWAGKFAARADDALSWLPARLSAALLRPTLRATAWRALRTEARRTPSPNGGWPMAALALRLGVRLRKPGVYTLNGGAPSPQAGHVAQALAWSGRAAWAAMAVASAAWWARAAWA